MYIISNGLLSLATFAMPKWIHAPSGSLSLGVPSSSIMAANEQRDEADCSC